MKNKKGDAPETIIWFGAIFLIFIIMLIFLGLTFGYLGIRKISGGENEILMNKNFAVLRGQNELITMLNSPLTDELKKRQTIRDLIIEWKSNKDNSLEENFKEKIKKEIDNFFKDKSMNYQIVILVNGDEKIRTGMKNICIRESERVSYKVPCSESEVFLLAGNKKIASQFSGALNSVGVQYDKIEIKLFYEI